MWKPCKQITLFEYEKTDIPLSLKEIDSIDKFLNKKPFTGILELLWGNYLKATSYVGIIKISGLTIQVLPKLFKSEEHDTVEATKNLFHFLQYTKKLSREIKEIEISSLLERKTDFFEVLIYFFAHHLLEILKRGLQKNYVIVEDQSNFLRGSWRIAEQISQSPLIKKRFFVRYDEFTEDNPLNRIFKYVARQLHSISVDEQNKNPLNEIILMYVEVRDLKQIVISDLRHIHFNRLNDEYKPIFDLAKLFLMNSSIQLTSGKNDCFAFVFDMNKLFEEFIFEFIRQENVLSNTKYWDCEICAQKGEEYLLFNEKKEGVFNLRPDIRIFYRNENKCIIDTKYKLLNPDTTYNGIIQSDMNQMYVYSERYNCERVILLYPKHLHSNSDQKYTTHKNRNIEVKTIDIGGDISKKMEKDELISEFKNILNTL